MTMILMTKAMYDFDAELARMNAQGEIVGVVLWCVVGILVVRALWLIYKSWR
jgi:hypothetical protein